MNHAPASIQALVPIRFVAQMRTELSSAKRRKVEVALDGPFKACGRVRDLQLIEAAVSAERSNDADITALRRSIGRRLRKKKHRLERLLARDHPRRIKRPLLTLAAEICGKSANPRQRDQVAATLFHNMERCIRNDDGASLRGVTPDSIHKTRKTLRAYRYQLALALRLGVPISADRLRKLTRVQAALGTINDRSILLSMLNRFIKRRPQADSLQRYRFCIEKQCDRLIQRQLPARATAGRVRSKSLSRASCP